MKLVTLYRKPLILSGFSRKIVDMLCSIDQRYAAKLSPYINSWVAN